MSRFLSASVLVLLLAMPVFAATNEFTIGRVEAIGLNDLPKQEAEQVRALLVGKTFDAEHLDFPQELLRGALQDMGYFKAQVGKPKISPLQAGENPPVLLSFSVSAGVRFHAGEISVTGAKTATPEELRRLIPLETGAIFSVSKIRKGLEAIRQWYASEGFINTVININQTISDDAKTVSIEIKVLETPQS
jgi:outer membrane protein insertion porin family